VTGSLILHNCIPVQNLPSLGIIDNTWKWAYGTIYSANAAIAELTAAKADPSKIAEAKVARAWVYYLLIDDFGDVPFYTDNNTDPTKKNRPKEQLFTTSLYLSLLQMLTCCLKPRGGSYYGRFNKWAGYMVLAKVYLNAGVYTGTPNWQVP
jgi:hypothetical protein